MKISNLVLPLILICLIANRLFVDFNFFQFFSATVFFVILSGIIIYFGIKKKETSLIYFSCWCFSFLAIPYISLIDYGITTEQWLPGFKWNFLTILFLINLFLILGVLSILIKNLNHFFIAVFFSYTKLKLYSLLIFFGNTDLESFWRLPEYEAIYFVEVKLKYNKVDTSKFPCKVHVREESMEDITFEDESVFYTELIVTPVEFYFNDLEKNDLSSFTNFDYETVDCNLILNEFVECNGLYYKLLNEEIKFYN